MIEIDGSKGEGGGQVLRTSLALSVITGQPVRLHSIRARRSKPGLRAQHLTCVEAAAAISSARVRGARVGASELTFEPGALQPGDYRFDIGTAGSTVLVLQTVLPALLRAEAPSTVSVRGGTHNTGAPPVDFLMRAFLPLVERQGHRVTVEVERFGFYPEGGGAIRATLAPCASPAPLELLERGAVEHIAAEALVANLPRTIAQREVHLLGEMLELDARQVHQVEAAGAGNAMFVAITCEHVTEVFTGFGQRGLRAEAIARGVGDAAKTWLAAGVPVGPHLADQLLLPIALAGQGAFRTTTPTEHTRTNVRIIEQFLPVRFELVEESFDAWRVTLQPRATV